MTGKDHYRLAEQLLRDVDQNQFHQGSGDPATRELLAAAQVHATLALAAATYDYDWDHAKEASR